MENFTTETRTYVGQTGTTAFDGFMGLRMGQRYTGVEQQDGRVLVLSMATPMSGGVMVTGEQWAKWFGK